MFDDKKKESAKKIGVSASTGAGAGATIGFMLGGPIGALIGAVVVGGGATILAANNEDNERIDKKNKNGK